MELLLSLSNVNGTFRTPKTRGTILHTLNQLALVQLFTPTFRLFSATLLIISAILFLTYRVYFLNPITQC